MKTRFATTNLVKPKAYLDLRIFCGLVSIRARYMNRLLPLVLVCGLAFTARADSTINTTNAYAWGANIGWTNWRPSTVDGVVIGEFVCSGYIWAANVGWIHLGDGTPTNNIQYSNTSNTDYGINYSFDSSQPGYGILRGYAYGANIGWINFEATGNPRVRFSDGALEGYAWSANCGWINLGDPMQHNLKTDHIAMGVDNDGDLIADAFEYQYFGGTGVANGSTDHDGDGISDKDEYLDGTSPIVASDRLHITVFSTSTGSTMSTVTWTSNAARQYYIETNPNLVAAWTLDPLYGMPFSADGATTTRMPTRSASETRRYYRVKAVRPLP